LRAGALEIGRGPARNVRQVHIHPLELAFSVANDRDGLRELNRRLAAAAVEIVALEASGGCERESCQVEPDDRNLLHRMAPSRRGSLTTTSSHTEEGAGGRPPHHVTYGSRARSIS
jgi:hypothetical protein